VTDNEISQVLTALPCLNCGDWRSDHIKAAIGRIYLAVEAGETLSRLPDREHLLRTCSKSDERTCLTFLTPANISW
jgi:hypothetical protein